MKARRAAFGPALAAALWAATASGQGPRTPETRRTVDVSTVVKLPDRASDETPWAPALPPLAGAVGWFWHHDVGAPDAYGPDETLLKGDLPFCFPEAAGLQVSLLGGRLEIRAEDSAAADRAARVYSELARECGGTTIVLLALCDEPPPRPVLTAAETAAFLSARAPRVATTATAPGIGDLRIRRGRDLTYVSDYDATAVGDVGLGDPVVRNLPLGLTATVSASESPAGGYVLRVAGVHGRLIALKRLSTGTDPRIGEVELPEIASVAVCGSAVVEDGGGFVVGAGEDGGYWFATARRATTRTAAADRTVFNCSALVRAPPRLPESTLVRRPFDSIRSWRSGHEQVDPAPLAVSAILEGFSEAAPEASADRRFAFSSGGVLIVPEGGGLARTLAAKAAEIARESLRTASVEFRYGTTEAGTTTVAGEAPAAALIAALPGRLSASALSGEPFRALAGVERAYLAETNAEIAGQAMPPMLDAYARPAFEGVCCEGVLARNATGGVDVAGTFLQLSGGAPEPGPRMSGEFPLALSRPDRLECELRATLERDVWRTLWTFTAEGRTFVLAARARD